VNVQYSQLYPSSNRIGYVLVLQRHLGINENVRSDNLHHEYVMVNQVNQSPIVVIGPESHHDSPEDKTYFESYPEDVPLMVVVAAVVVVLAVFEDDRIVLHCT